MHFTPRCDICGTIKFIIEDEDHGITGDYCPNKCTQCDAHRDEDGVCPNKCDEPDMCVRCDSLAAECTCE